MIIPDLGLRRPGWFDDITASHIDQVQREKSHNDTTDTPTTAGQGCHNLSDAWSPCPRGGVITFPG